MGLRRHRASAKTYSSARVAVVVVSDRITPERDTSGRLAAAMLASAGHRIVYHDIVANNSMRLTRHLRRLLRRRVDMIMTIGGTGVSARDISVETTGRLMTKTLDGFGELFRRFSQAKIGTAAMMSRAAMGIRGRTVLVSVPGSPAAVRLALKKLILPELGHLLAELHKS